MTNQQTADRQGALLGAIDREVARLLDIIAAGGPNVDQARQALNRQAQYRDAIRAGMAADRLFTKGGAR